MSQANPAPITRRTLFARATPVVATGAVAATGLALASKPMQDGWPEFIVQMRRLHPNGEKVARKAMRAGVELRDLAHVHWNAGENDPDIYPMLTVRQPNGRFRHVTASDRRGHEGLI